MPHEFLFLYWYSVDYVPLEICIGNDQVSVETLEQWEHNQSFK